MNKTNEAKLLQSTVEKETRSRLGVACEAQTYFRSSLLSLRKLTSANPSSNDFRDVGAFKPITIFGGREATTGNTSALRRLGLAVNKKIVMSRAPRCQIVITWKRIS